MEIERRQAAGGRIRKRKADSDGASERLSKVSRKLSLLNLGIDKDPVYYTLSCSLLTDCCTERNAAKVDIPPSLGSSSKPTVTTPPQAPIDDVMQMDNTSHKVYIYNLDDELSDSDSSSSSADDNKLRFLPDFEKRLRQSRIPSSILANSDGELAGRNLSNELVLYNVPSSLSVPEGQDSVRKAIIETRARAREKARREQERARTAPMDIMNFMRANAGGQRPPFVRMDASNDPAGPAAGTTNIMRSSDMEELDDADAMELD